MKHIALLLLLAPFAMAQTCAPPAQAGAGSGSYTIKAGATYPVTWAPSPTAGCTTYFTIDGSTPTSSSPVYTGQTIPLTQTTVILMVAQGPGKAASAQVGGKWVITVTGTAPPPPPVTTPGKPIALSCTPSTASTAANPGTTTLFRAVSPSTNFTQLAAGLPPACTYTDAATVAGTTYSYYAVAVIGGQQSAPSASAVIALPAAPTITMPTVSVTFSPAAIDNATATTASIAVSGTPAPTGTVTLTSGAFVSAATTLTNGSAAISIPANTLDVGALSFTATYTPDAASASVYAASTGTGALPVTPVAPQNLTGSVVK
jgi:hypothetical protein